VLENKWSRDYLRGLFETTGRTYEDLQNLVLAWTSADFEDPLLEIRAMRHGGSAVEGFNFAVAELALCKEDAPLSLLAELIETVEICMMTLNKAQENLPALKEAVFQDPTNGEKHAKLGFGLYALDVREEALTALTNALEYPSTLCFDCHRDCLNNIGWEHYRRGEYEQALGWFQMACNLEDAAKKDDRYLEGDNEARADLSLKIAFENVLVTLAKLGRLEEATKKVEEYHDRFGRLGDYESRALEKLGLQPDVIFIRSCTRAVGGEEG
jgi:tetratricopeptide (TPR) repeat protein